MASVADWSPVAASNTSVGGISTDGNVTLVKQIDNMIRGLMAEVATSRDDGTINANSARRNAIINGDFQVWQRSTSVAPTNGQISSADRWATSFDGSGATRLVTRQTHTLGQTDVPGNPKYFYRYTQSVAGSGATFNALTQAIDGVSTFASTKVTLTFYAKASLAATLPTISLIQNFGTGGSPSAVVTTAVATSVAITTSWTKFTYTVTLPSIAGKTLGTADDLLRLDIQLPLNTTFAIDFSHISLVAGDATTAADAFLARPLSEEIALCQRFYVQLTSSVTAAQSICMTQHLSTITATGVVATPVPMRATQPTVGVALGSPNDFRVVTTGTLTTSAITGSALTTNGNTTVVLSITTSATTAGFAGFLRTNALGTGIISVDAEII